MEAIAVIVMAAGLPPQLHIPSNQTLQIRRKATLLSCVVPL
jgi:hypothetical protein